MDFLSSQHGAQERRNTLKVLLDHYLLARKLKILGVGGPLLRWILSFVTNRNQSVRVNGMLFGPAPVVSGVCHGSVLVHLFFLVFIAERCSGLGP